MGYVLRYFDRYLDALLASWFKTAQDGRKLFYPWGIWSRGYAITSEQDYKRVQLQIKVYMIVLVVLMIGAFYLQGYLALFVVGASMIVFYIVWTPYLVRGLQPSDEKMSLQESYASQAVAHSAVMLWSMEIVSLAAVGISIVILFGNSDNWLIALASTVLFGLCAAAITWMLVLRRRASHR